MTARFLPDYPALTCWHEGIIHNESNFDDVDIYYVVWSKPGHPVKDMERVAERIKESSKLYLRDVGPDPA